MANLRTIRIGPKPANSPNAPKATPPPKLPPKPQPRPESIGALFNSWPRWRRVFTTGVFATVIISGAIWGATLKMKKEANEKKKQVLEATVDEKVDILEQRRKHLMRQKDEIQVKLDSLHAKMKARESGQSGREM